MYDSIKELLFTVHVLLFAGLVGNLSIIERVADSSSDLTGSHFDDAFESSDVTESREQVSAQVSADEKSALKRPTISE